jgi:hypothetical protein
VIASTVVCHIHHKGFALSVERDPNRQTVQVPSFYPRRPSARSFGVPDYVVELKDWFLFEEGTRKVPIYDRVICFYPKAISLPDNSPKPVIGSGNVLDEDGCEVSKDVSLLSHV